MQCLENEYGCSDGQCISLVKRCDEISDCEDKFDELNCETVSVNKKIYRKEYPPFTNSEIPTSVTVKITVHSISNIKEIEQTFNANLFLQLEWYTLFVFHEFIFIVFHTKKMNHFELPILGHLLLLHYQMRCAKDSINLVNDD